ncbi:MAG: group I intron-associated PD-(D/E)XK endonuclease [Bacteroidota bacterium]
MHKHHTKTLGDLGVLKAQVDLYQKGYWVSIPLTEHAPFDLVITNSSGSKTVQVKARSLNSKGVLEIPFRQSYSTKNGVQTTQWDKNSIDIVCVYCPETDQCYYFNPSRFGRTISLRVKAPKNNQIAGINFADDYREVP